MSRVDKGNHPCLSEDWLLDNLPNGWTYDCQTFTGQDGFIIWDAELVQADSGEPLTPKNSLFIPLDLLKSDRSKP